MSSLASALVLNIGTLTVSIVESMRAAAIAANRKGIPVVLDVCGAGATAFRDEVCLNLLKDVQIDVIKGNASEVARIAGEDVRSKGVDAAEVSGDLRSIARTLAVHRRSTVVITGKVDIVANGNELYLIENGTDMMSEVVGTGCMAASVIGTFAGASPERLIQACVAGLVCYEVAAELAAGQSAGPGSFKVNLFDRIHRLTEDEVAANQRATKVSPH